MFILAFLAIRAVRAWTEPNTTTLGGVEAPLVAGPTTQEKAGPIEVYDVLVRAAPRPVMGPSAPEFPDVGGMWLSSILKERHVESVDVEIVEAIGRNPEWTAVASCPQNTRYVKYILLTCSGARDDQVADSCSGEGSCGLIGSGPDQYPPWSDPNYPYLSYDPPTSCRTSIVRGGNAGRDMETVAHAYCLRINKFRAAP